MSSPNSEKLKLSVLYIDEELNASTTKDLLKEKCENLFFAQSKKEALDLFKQSNFELVIIDIEIPELGGVALVKEIKKNSLDTHIIIVSSFKIPELLLEIIDIGVDNYVKKPVNLKQFQRALDKSFASILKDKSMFIAQNNLKQYEKVINSSAIYSKADPEGIITYANKGFCDITGYSQEELIGSPHSIIRHPDMPAEVFAEMWKTIKSGKIWKGIIKNRRKDDTSYTVESTIIPIFDINNTIVEYVAIRHDITELANKNNYLELLAKERGEQLFEFLYHDDNTGLLNILSLQKDILNYNSGTMFLLDINNFNIYNKLHGFSFGDKILNEVGHLLREIAMENEEVYKVGADRYAILSKIYNETYIDNFVNQVFAFFDTNEIVIDTIENLITFSIGVAKIVNGLDTIINAEFALDLSKKHGKKFKLVYESESEKISQEKENIAWLKKTREYILTDMIVPHYQPIVDVQTEKLFKYEALARVIDGDKVITPDKFLNAASRLGLLSSVTKSMINKSFKKFSGTDVSFSINITERDIMDGYLVDFIKVKSKRYNIEPKNVTFEILENLTLSEDGDFISKTISLVKDYGCEIAIDDFGSENSNFSRILSLKSDYIKVDGAFVINCDKDLEKQKIIAAIVQLAKRLEIKTIAEYVSTKEIFETVRDLGIDYAQGYYFGMPELL